MSDSITLIDLQDRMAEGVPPGKVDESTVRRLWWAALETLQVDILLPMEPKQGLWLASPLPALYEPKLLDFLKGWVWAPEELETLQTPCSTLLPPSRVKSIKDINDIGGGYQRFQLRNDDGYDPLLLIITPQVQVALALQGHPGSRQLLMRSDPETLTDLMRMLDLRLEQEDQGKAAELRQALAELGELRSGDLLEKLFWPRLSERLAEMAPSLTLQPIPDKTFLKTTAKESSSELTLLGALTHEVRTPLATIRTLIRSLLRRKDLPEVVINRLQQIDVECTEQIDRFGLIFNAAEVQRQPPDTSKLARTDLGDILELLHPAWNLQLERRGIKLVLDITPDLPPVLSDPEGLEQMLGGLIDRSSRGLSPGGTLSLLLRPAGPRLKLQILREDPNADKPELSEVADNSELGPVLSWNPNTGSLQLSQAATRRLLASLGGRLTNRRDSGLTVFFPVAEGVN